MEITTTYRYSVLWDVADYGTLVYGYLLLSSIEITNPFALTKRFVFGFICPIHKIRKRDAASLPKQ
jgi:hypothetical protein